MASADSQPHAQHDIKAQGSSAKLTVEYGDFAEPLKKAVAALQEVPVSNSVYIDYGNLRGRIIGEEIYCK